MNAAYGLPGSFAVGDAFWRDGMMHLAAFFASSVRRDAQHRYRYIDTRYRY
jgi:hypothetical protein